MKILISEDDAASRKFMFQFMERYGECDMVVDGLETIDAFLIALREQKPYDLIFLDIMMPKLDGMKTLKAIRDLEKQYGIAAEKCTRIILTTALDETRLVEAAFGYGCDAYAAKPIDTKKLMEVMEKLGLLTGNIGGKPGLLTEAGVNGSGADVISVYSSPEQEGAPGASGYFRKVQALPGCRLEVTMETGTTIYFDFSSRLGTVRFGKLKDEELFLSVRTDGNYLIFDKAGSMPLKIAASEFMDLVLIDRGR
jgi:two-component system chemotaxis response regulator CheY